MTIEFLKVDNNKDKFKYIKLTNNLIIHKVLYNKILINIPVIIYIISIN